VINWCYIIGAHPPFKKKGNWLVVWNIYFMFPYIGNVMIPIDELHIFSGVGGSTTNQVSPGELGDDLRMIFQDFDGRFPPNF
jgi:hypothetical protein